MFPRSILLSGVVLLAAPLGASPHHASAPFVISVPASGGEHYSGAPAVAANPDDGELLVVWHQVTDRDGHAPSETEIYAQVFNSSSRQPKLPEPVRVSAVGGMGDPDLYSREPSAVWNPSRREYLVVWHGRGSLAEGWEIWVRRLSASGAAIGSEFAVTQMGGASTSAGFAGFEPTVVWNSSHQEYLVVWHGSHNEWGLVAHEREVFGRRLAWNGSPVGPMFRISTMGGTGDQSGTVGSAHVAWDPVFDEYAVVWDGRDGWSAPWRIYMQLLEATGAKIGGHYPLFTCSTGSQSCAAPRIAFDAGSRRYAVTFRKGEPAGDEAIRTVVVDHLTGPIAAAQPMAGAGLSRTPDIVWGGLSGRFLLVWVESNGSAALGASAGGLSVDGLATIPHALEVFVGPFGGPPRIAAANHHEALVVWQGRESALEEVGIWGRFLWIDPPLFADGFESGDLGAWSGSVW